MADKDGYSLISSFIPMSYRGGGENFARSLHLKLKSLTINQQDDDEDDDENNRELWHPNGNGHQSSGFEYQPLSPEDEIENPLDGAIILDTNNRGDDHIDSSDVVSNGSFASSFYSPIDGSPIDPQLERCNSMDEVYETASDHSADDDETAENNHLQKTAPQLSVVQDEIEQTTPNIRRCSSLKTGKTPPDTPGRKKIVRFADAMGLDLADVKTFVDDIPKVPTSAFQNLRYIKFEDDIFSNKPKQQKRSEKILIPIFQQPICRPDFLEIVRTKYVSLENAFVEDPVSFAIRGLVRVRNIDFHKSVLVRYSIDSWKSFVDITANYEPNSCDGFSDKFSFLIYANMLNAGQKIEFAIAFQARGEQFWDNNGGSNYCFQCIVSHAPTVPPITHVDPWEEWGAAFY